MYSLSYLSSQVSTPCIITIGVTHIDPIENRASIRMIYTMSAGRKKNLLKVMTPVNSEYTSLDQPYSDRTLGQTAEVSDTCDSINFVSTCFVFCCLVVCG